MVVHEKKSKMLEPSQQTFLVQADLLVLGKCLREFFSKSCLDQQSLFHWYIFFQSASYSLF